MANGDITKEIEYDKIEVVQSWSIQVRKATKIMEENADGSLTELSADGSMIFSGTYRAN